MNRDPLREIMPAWYEIGVDKPNTLSIRIHRQAMGHVRIYVPRARRWLADLQTKLGLKPFIEPRESQWVFGPVLTREEEKNPAWEKFVCPLPLIRTEQTDEQGIRVGQKDGLAVRSTLAALFTALWLFDEQTDAAQPQLLVLEKMLVECRSGGGALVVSVTPALCLWLSKQPDHSRLIAVKTAMIQAWYQMWPPYRRGYDDWDFEVLCRSVKWINLDVPGNASGLDPQDYRDGSPEQGYYLLPHNVDSTLQQLTLLMGLAKLHDLARGGK